MCIAAYNQTLQCLLSDQIIVTRLFLIYIVHLTFLQHQTAVLKDSTMKLCVFVVLVCFSNALPWESNVFQVKQPMQSNDEFVNFDYHKEYKVIDDAEEIIKRVKDSSNLTLGAFVWTNCGSPDDTIKLKTLQVSPDPIVIPGSVTVTLDAIIAQTIKTATSVALVVKKKVFGVFIEVPCVSNFGSCTYQSPCNLLANVTCPPELVKLGWTCRCPIPGKEYEVPGVEFKIPSIPLPPSLENGDYQIQATLMNGATRLGCYQVDASLKAT